MSKEMTRALITQMLAALDNAGYDDTIRNYGMQSEAITAAQEYLAAPEQEPVAYPEGDVVGPCGSWPGGKCLKCPRITTPSQPTELREIYSGFFHVAKLSADTNATMITELEADGDTDPVITTLREGLK
jgi:hypothetical protein